MKKVLILFLYFFSLWGLEYKFNVIAEIPRSVSIDVGGFHLFIDDTDHNGLKELIFSTNYYYYVYRRPTIPWDRTDDKGRKLPNGIYFLRLNTKNHSLTCKVIMVKLP